ncbi:hypothetical protein AgCh_007045 [Apium graveolens]
MSTTECSSGCESGWTAYLDQSSNSTYDKYKSERTKRVTLQDEDEDLSMVSDASSWPRHDKQGKIKKRNTKITENKGKFIEDCCLDDTASSPVLSFSKASLLHSFLVLFRNKIRKFKKMALSTNQASYEQETQGEIFTESASRVP